MPAQTRQRTSIMSLASTVKERDSSATFRLGSRLKMSCGVWSGPVCGDGQRQAMAERRWKGREAGEPQGGMQPAAGVVLSC